MNYVILINMTVYKPTSIIFAVAINLAPLEQNPLQWYSPASKNFAPIILSVFLATIFALERINDDENFHDSNPIFLSEMQLNSPESPFDKYNTRGNILLLSAKYEFNSFGICF